MFLPETKKFLKENKKIKLSNDYSDGSYYSQYNIPEFFIESGKYFKKNGNALDIGCGNGRISKFLKDNFKMNIDAFDPEPAGVKAARKLGINAKLSDSDNYNYKVDYYDLIICLNITHHLLLESQEHLFKNIKLGLKKNGILALSIYESINDVSVGSMVESEFEHILKMKQIEKIPYTKGSKKFFYYIYKN